MADDIVWITLPYSQERKIQRMLKSFWDEPHLNIHEFIKFIELKEKIGSQAEKRGESTKKDDFMRCWLEGVANIYCFKSLMQAVEGAKSIRDRFNEKDKKTGQLIYPKLNDKKFSLNQLIGLLIFHSSGPNLISSNLCQALSDDNFFAIKKEFLENSMEVKKEENWRELLNLVNPELNKRHRLVSESESNLRLFSYALFSKDVNVMLPFKTIGKMTGRMMKDYRGGFRAAGGYIDGMVKADLLEKNCLYTLKNSRLGWDEEIAFKVEQDKSEKIVEFKRGSDYGFNELKNLEMRNNTLRRALFKGELHNISTINKSFSQESYKPSTAHANGVDLNSLLVGGVAFWNIVANTPIGAIVRNIRSDVVAVGNYIGTFFSKNTLKSCEGETVKSKETLPCLFKS